MRPPPRNLRRVPIEDITEPRQGYCWVLLDHWWVTDGKGNVFFYDPFKKNSWGSPQCNFNKAIAEMVAKRSLTKHIEGVEVIQIPIAFIPHHCED